MEYCIIIFLSGSKWLTEIYVRHHMIRVKILKQRPHFGNLAVMWWSKNNQGQYLVKYLRYIRLVVCGFPYLTWYNLWSSSMGESYGPVTLGRIDLTYKKRMLLVNVRFMFLLCPVIISQMRSCQAMFLANTFMWGVNVLPDWWFRHRLRYVDIRRYW